MAVVETAVPNPLFRMTFSGVGPAYAACSAAILARSYTPAPDLYRYHMLFTAPASILPNERGELQFQSSLEACVEIASSTTTIIETVCFGQFTINRGKTASLVQHFQYLTPYYYAGECGLTQAMRHLMRVPSSVSTLLAPTRRGPSLEASAVEHHAYIGASTTPNENLKVEAESAAVEAAMPPLLPHLPQLLQQNSNARPSPPPRSTSIPFERGKFRTFLRALESAKEEWSPAELTVGRRVLSLGSHHPSSVEQTFISIIFVPTEPAAYYITLEDFEWVRSVVIGVSDNSYQSLKVFGSA